MSRFASIILAFSLAFVSATSWALGLGSLISRSALNQPFKGEIELFDANVDELDNIQVKLAGVDEFEKASVPRPFFLTELDFKPGLNAAGEPVIQISSRNPVREPFIDFLVEVEWSEGRIVKEYTILLDPPRAGAEPPEVEVAGQVISSETFDARPVATASSDTEDSPPEVAQADNPESEDLLAQMGPQAEPEAADASAAPASEAKASDATEGEAGAPDEPAASADAGREETADLAQATPVPANPAQAAVSDGDAGQFPIRFGPVAAGVGLWRAASTIRPEDATVQQTAMALYRSNPEAFGNGSVNNLITGSSLVIPSAAELFALDADEAGRQFQAALDGESVPNAPLAGDVAEQLASAESATDAVKKKPEAPSLAAEDSGQAGEGPETDKPSEEQTAASADTSSDQAASEAASEPASEPAGPEESSPTAAGQQEVAPEQEAPQDQIADDPSPERTQTPEAVAETAESATQSAEQPDTAETSAPATTADAAGSDKSGDVTTDATAAESQPDTTDAPTAAAEQPDAEADARTATESPAAVVGAGEAETADTASAPIEATTAATQAGAEPAQAASQSAEEAAMQQRIRELEAQLNKLGTLLETQAEQRADAAPAESQGGVQGLNPLLLWSLAGAGGALLVALLILVGVKLAAGRGKTEAEADVEPQAGAGSELEEIEVDLAEIEETPVPEPVQAAPSAAGSEGAKPVPASEPPAAEARPPKAAAPVASTPEPAPAPEPAPEPAPTARAKPSPAPTPAPEPTPAPGPAGGKDVSQAESPVEAAPTPAPARAPVAARPPEASVTPPEASVTPPPRAVASSPAPEPAPVTVSEPPAQPKQVESVRPEPPAAAPAEQPAAPARSLDLTASAGELSAPEKKALDKANGYISHGHHRDAQVALTTALGQLPDSDVLQLKLAESYVGAGDKDDLDQLRQRMVARGLPERHPEAWARLSAVAGAAGIAASAAATPPAQPAPEPTSLPEQPLPEQGTADGSGFESFGLDLNDPDEQDLGVAFPEAAGEDQQPAFDERSSERQARLDQVEIVPGGPDMEVSLPLQDLDQQLGTGELGDSIFRDLDSDGEGRGLEPSENDSLVPEPSQPTASDSDDLPALDLPEFNEVTAAPEAESLTPLERASQAAKTNRGVDPFEELVANELGSDSPGPAPDPTPDPTPVPTVAADSGAADSLPDLDLSPPQEPAPGQPPVDDGVPPLVDLPDEPLAPAPASAPESPPESSPESLSDATGGGDVAADIEKFLAGGQEDKPEAAAKPEVATSEDLNLEMSSEAGFHTQMIPSSAPPGQMPSSDLPDLDMGLEDLDSLHASEPAPASEPKRDAPTPASASTETATATASSTAAEELGLRESSGEESPMFGDESLMAPDSGASDVLSSQWRMDSGMWDEVATKMDLAFAYVEMEDSEAARAILEEVIREGNDEQRAEAQGLLKKLDG